MLKLIVAFMLLFIASCGGSGCTDAAVATLRSIDAGVHKTAGDQLTKEKYIALVADAWAKVDRAQQCLPASELNGELNEHMRNALIYYDDAKDVWGTDNTRQLKEYWELAREELGKIK